MPPPAPADVTQLLRAWRGGSQGAFDRLMPLVYEQLRQIARRHLRHERPDHSLQATALVNEAYLRLVDVTRLDYHDRAHFFAMAARVMRRVLVDHARARRYQKRGGSAVRVTLDEGLAVGDRGQDLIALDDALEALEKVAERKCRIVELRFFAGLNVEEIAGDAIAFYLSPTAVALRRTRPAAAVLTRPKTSRAAS